MSKGGGSLSMWIKEFTALVFTQTIQAFVYAMVITIILFGMTDNTSTKVSSDDNNAALGLMSTFALLSVFKVEEMAKKIFGVGDTKASHGNAMRSIAKTAVAAKLGGRVLNNAGKVFSGAKAIGQAGQDRRKAKKRLDEDMKDNGFEMGADGKPKPISKGSSRGAGSSTGSPMSDGRQAYFDKAKAAKAKGDMEGYRYNMGVAVGMSKAGGEGSGSGGSGNTEMSGASYRRVKNALRTYEDKAAEINKARNEGIKSMISGVVETVGAGVGATAGGLLGGADGNIDEMLQGMMAGAGLGDVAGKNMVDAVERATKFVQRNVNREAGMSNKKLQAAISEYKDALNKATVNYNSSSVDDI